MEHPLADAWQEVQSTTRPVGKSLFRSEEINVVVFAFKEGMELKDHTAKWPSQLTVLKGTVVYSEKTRTYNLSELQSVDIPQGESHWVLATEDSLCLLIQTKPQA